MNKRINWVFISALRIKYTDKHTYIQAISYANSTYVELFLILLMYVHKYGCTNSTIPWYNTLPKTSGPAVIKTLLSSIFIVCLTTQSSYVRICMHMCMSEWQSKLPYMYILLYMYVYITLHIHASKNTYTKACDNHHGSNLTFSSQAKYLSDQLNT